MRRNISSFNLRQLDNFHILTWLIKDICWVKEYKPGGMFMIVPTIGIAFLMAWKTRRYKARFYSNFSVFCWMCADSVWMMDDFYELNASAVTVGFFITGILSMAYYYAFVGSGNKRQ